MFKVKDQVVHVKTGGTYEIISTPSAYMRLENCNEPFYSYRNVKLEMIVWHRCKSEMEDGRFVLKGE